MNWERCAIDSMMSETQATEKKRKDLQLVIDHFIEPVPAFRAVIAVGSVGTGQAREGSDIDAVIFMDPVDRYILPTEAIWCPWDDTFHSIFVDDRRIQREGIHLDLIFRDLRQWSNETFDWPEPDKAGLVRGWLAYDRDGTVEPLVRRRTEYDERIRAQRLDSFLLAVDAELVDNRPEKTWDRHGPVVALRRLEYALDAIVGGLFAYNRSWRFYRDRETVFLLQLPWLPRDFVKSLHGALQSSSPDKQGFMERATATHRIAMDLIKQLQLDGEYGTEPFSEAFVRTYDEPGRASNLEEWNRKRRTPI
jgi:hypothetical protein